MLDSNLILQRRNERRLSMRDMTELMGYASPNSYFRLEHGESRGSVRQLELLAEILELSWAELLGPSPVVSQATIPIERRL